MKMERLLARGESPAPPPPPPKPSTSYSTSPAPARRQPRAAASLVEDAWDRLFDEAYRADVVVRTDNDGVLYAHASILGTASPVLKAMLDRPSNRSARRRKISIVGVPPGAVRAFLRFLYSSRYEDNDMEEFSLHLLALSHCYVVPRLKRECERSLERAGALTSDNVLDVFQLALLCDAPRLGLICHRRIVGGLKSVTASEAWVAMKESHPVLEKQILHSAVSEANMKSETTRRKNERKVYGQLCEAMEALVHICKEGCRTIGPHDKVLKEGKEPCGFAACDGIESLLRHFAACKPRAPRGCVRCKRTWQLLELHSRLCADSRACRVPLCMNFKEKVKKQSNKEDMKWRILVRKILVANCILKRAKFSWAIPISS